MPKNNVKSANAASTANANPVQVNLGTCYYSNVTGSSTNNINAYPKALSAMSTSVQGNIVATTLNYWAATQIFTLTTKSSINSFNSELTYSPFTGSVVVPAREQYKVTYSFTGTITKYGQAHSTNLAAAAMEFLDFGNATSFPTSLTVAGGTGVTNSTYSKFIGSASTVGASDTQTYSTTVTYANDSDTARTFTSYFAFRASKHYTNTYQNRFTATCEITATVTQVDLLDIETPQNVTQVFNGNDMIAAGSIDSAITSRSWYYGNRMDFNCSTGAVRNVGTHTVTAALSAYALSENVEWITDPTTNATTTADQTFSFVITPKSIAFTLNKKVPFDTYGDTDAGVVEASYSGVDTTDENTPQGPNLVIYYRSADGYGYGAGAGDDSGKGLGSLTAPTLAGKYIATAEDLNDSTSNYSMSGTPLNFEIKPKGVTAVTAPAQTTKTYNGSMQDFLLNNSFDATTMEIKRDGGLTPDANGNYTDGVVWDSANTKISVTNADVYRFEFVLKDKRNNCWLPYPAAGGTFDTADKPITLTIDKYDLSPHIQPDPANTAGNAAGTTTWALGAAGQIVLQVSTQGTDTVSLYLDYLDSSSNPYRIGVTDSTYTLDVSQISLTGNYTLRARLMGSTESGYVAANDNYEIATSDNYYKFNFTVGAGIANVALKWTYSTGGIPAPLFDSLGAQAQLIFDENVSYAIDAAVDSSTSYASIDRTTARNNYTNGIYTFRQDGAPCDMKSAGVYITRIAVLVDTAHEFDAAHSFGTNGNKEGWVEIQWEIEPQELDFSNSQWQYSTDYDRTNPSAGATWTNFSSPAQVEVSALYIYNVRLDPAYIQSLGLDPVNDITVRYTDDEYSTKGIHVTTAEVTVSNTNYILPNNVSPYRFTFSWEITSKQIVFDGWEDDGAQVTLADGRIFGVPVLKARDGGDYTKYLTYTFTDKLTGVQYNCSADPVTGKTDYSPLLPVVVNASDTNQLEFDVSVAVASAHTGDYILTGAIPTTVKFGASKSPVKVELSGDGTQYGEVEFGISATYQDNGADVAFDGTLYTVTVTKDGNILGTFTGGEVENIKECFTAQGVYGLEFKITDTAATRRYAFDKTQLKFTVAQKVIALPTAEDIVFNGGYITVSEYFDATLKAYIADGIVKFAGGSSFRDAGDYIAYLEITDNNYVWETPAAIAPAKYKKLNAQVSTDGAKLDLPWTIGKAQLTSDSWNLNGKNGATLNALAAWQDKINAGEVEVGLDYRYYDNGKNLLETVEFKGGKTFLVDAYLTGADANNFEFVNGVGAGKLATEQVEYKVPQSGLMAAAGTAINFVKSNWLWFLIGFLVLLFLIILIVVIAKRRKSKEERLAKKEAKEEEKRRKEEEREAEKRRREQELELQKAKQEAELAKMKAELGLGAGMAGVAMAAQAQPQQAPIQQMPQQQPMQMPMPQPMMQQMPQYMPPAQPYPAYGPQPYPQMPQNSEGGMMAMMQAQLIQLQAEKASAMNTQMEILKLRMDQGNTNAGTAQRSESPRMPDTDMEKVAALATAIWRNMQTAAKPEIKELPAEESKPVSVAYPPDAVVTTTTTVDTTKLKPERSRRDEIGRSDFFDVDGFYDEIDG